MSLVFVSVLTWFLFIPIAIINGVLREKIYKRYTGELRAHQLSTITAALAFFMLVYTLLRDKIFSTSRIELLLIGILWVVMTVLFEFGFGRYVDKLSWEKLLTDYNIFKGRVWSLFLLIICFTPLLIKTINPNNNSEDTEYVVRSSVTEYARTSGYSLPEVTVDFIQPSQARGTIQDAELGNGAKWFAAKIQNQWTVVYIGNGLPKCSDVAIYNLSKDFLNCYE